MPSTRDTSGPGLEERCLSSGTQASHPTAIDPTGVDPAFWKAPTSQTLHLILAPPSACPPWQSAHCWFWEPTRSHSTMHSLGQETEALSKSCPVPWLLLWAAEGHIILGACPRTSDSQNGSQGPQSPGDTGQGTHKLTWPCQQEQRQQPEQVSHP